MVISDSTPRSARVRVPGSTSNLGSGFDCVGIAVDRWLDATATISFGGNRGITIRRHGAMADVSAAAADDLVTRGFFAACESAGAERPDHLTFVISSEIPIARGLGSSAAAVVSGARLADALLGLALPRARLLRLCARIEGHPDNVTPALYGGAVLAVHRGDDYAVSPLDVSPALSFVYAIPEFVISTEEARAVLPLTLPFAHAVTAAARAAALVRGLATGDPALLAAALDDVLHTPFRRHLIPGFDEVSRAAASAGAFGVTLSGSGSTLLAIAPRGAAATVGIAMQRAWAAHGITATHFESSAPVPGAHSVALDDPPAAHTSAERSPSRGR